MKWGHWIDPFHSSIHCFYDWSQKGITWILKHYNQLISVFDRLTVSLRFTALKLMVCVNCVSTYVLLFWFILLGQHSTVDNETYAQYKAVIANKVISVYTCSVMSISSHLLEKSNRDTPLLLGHLSSAN